jgi:predicted NUDIX family phosphoesterase
MSLVKTEHILVIPTQLFRELGYFQGFSPNVACYRDTLFDPLHTSYRPRDEMESDPTFKQLIPYVIFRWTEGARVHLFQYQRGKGQGESRLHRLRSIGVGGHISTLDATEQRPYEEGMRRELDEELVIDTEYQSRCVGLINDDRNEVGQVHLGIVHICDVATPRVEAREPDLLDAGFRPVDELIRNIDEFETWSQICLTALF